MPHPVDISPRNSADRGLDALCSIARNIADEGDLTADQRLRRLFRKLAFSLTPAQHEHIAAHGEHVARTAARLAACMRLPRDAQDHARLVGLLHDVGKLTLPHHVLEHLARRAGAQPEMDGDLLAQIPAASATICRALGIDEDTCDAVAHCAVRFDAPAPPPLSARIVAVADTIVVHTSAPSGSPARTFTAALAHLRKGRAMRFDPEAVIAAHMLGATAMSIAA